MTSYTAEVQTSNTSRDPYPTRVAYTSVFRFFFSIVEILLDMEDNGEEKDQDTIKLFVGQIPRTYTEDDLKEIFQEFGDIHDVTVLREKATNQHRGKNLPLYLLVLDYIHPDVYFLPELSLVYRV